VVPKGEQWPSDVYLPKDLQRVTGPPRSSARELVVVRVFPTAPSMNLNSPQVTRGREYVREIVPPAGNSSAPPAAGPVASPSTVLAARAPWLRQGYALHARIEVIVRGKRQPARVVGHRSVMGTRRAVDELEVRIDGADSSIFLTDQLVAVYVPRGQESLQLLESTYFCVLC
jgi:hypothetical protein